MTLKIEDRDVSSLIPYARNARTHSDQQIAEIAASIREFGFTNPILIDERDGIIAGHGRVLAAQLLKMEQAPCIVLSHLTETQKRAYIIADNKIALNAGWNEELLRLEFLDLKSEGFDLGLTGFTADELADFDLDASLGGLGGTGDGRDGPDLMSLVNVVIEEPKTQCKHGDVFYLTRDGVTHALYVVSVINDWPLWLQELSEGAKFCPFPGVFVLLSPGAGKSKCVLVQPDTYVAGHIVDRFIDVYGADAVEVAKA